jgi:predicted nuclease with TOPRIM domain
VSSIPAGLEILIPVLVYAAFALQKFKRGITDTWREEAEAQKERADRLAAQVEILTQEVKALRAENAELRKLLSDDHLGTFLGGEGE